MQVYHCMVDGVVESFGSGTGLAAPMDVVFELVDEGAASNTPATVLYDSAAVSGAIAGTPALATFVVVNSTADGGVGGERECDAAGESVGGEYAAEWGGADSAGGKRRAGCGCEATYGTSAGTAGKVTFFTGCVPVANERVTVMYRGRAARVARLQDAASVAAEVAGGASGTCRWLGKVSQPVARSSADCEMAAEAILAFATSRMVAVAGTYACVNPASDVWPGDVLSVTSLGDFVVSGMERGGRG